MSKMETDEKVVMEAKSEVKKYIDLQKTSNIIGDGGLGKVYENALIISKAVWEVARFKKWNAFWFRKYLNTILTEVDPPILVSAGISCGSKWMKILKKRGEENGDLWNYLGKMKVNSPGGIEGKTDNNNKKPLSPEDITLPRVMVAYPDLTVMARMSLLSDPKFSETLSKDRAENYIKAGLPKQFHQVGLADVVPAYLATVYYNCCLEIGKKLNGDKELTQAQKDLTSSIVFSNVGKFTCFDEALFLKMWRGFWEGTGTWNINDFRTPTKDPGAARAI